VLYEIGYAIAVGKPVIPTVNIAIAKAVKRIQQIGLFDTIGWRHTATRARFSKNCTRGKIYLGQVNILGGKIMVSRSSFLIY
jgi:hypothetical protein